MLYSDTSFSSSGTSNILKIFGIIQILRKISKSRQKYVYIWALGGFLGAVLYSPSVDPLRVYYGTGTRAAGFLVGAMSAILWAPWKVSHGSSREKLEVLGCADELLCCFSILNLTNSGSFCIAAAFS